MAFEWFVARRYLTARRRQAFISLISTVSILGVGVGVMALIIALALMTGVQSELRDRIVGSSAHLYVYKFGRFVDLEADLARLAGEPGVEAAAPAILDKGLMSTSGNPNPIGIELKGVDPAVESAVTELGAAMVAGAPGLLARRLPDDPFGILLGTGLARELGVTIGETVRVVTAQLVTTPSGAAPKIRAFTVVGLFEFGFYATDHATAIISLDEAESLLGRDGPDLIQLRLTDLDAAPALRERLAAQLGTGYLVRDWTQLNQELYAALWLEKVAISLTIGLIIMVAALNIVASLVLLVMEKSRDIAILRTMGASARSVRRIFVFQGLTIGLVGTMAGTGLGLIACWVGDRYRLISLPADVYQITYLPFRVEWQDVGVVIVGAVVVCLLATIYPSRQAGRLDPAEALRHQ